MLETRIEELTAAVRALTEVLKNHPAASSPIVTREVVTLKEEAPNAKIGETKSQPTTSTSPTSSSESAPVTYDDVKRATNAVSKISRDKAVAGLACFGVASATKLPENRWAEYVAYMTRVAAGELDPENAHE